MSRVKRNCRCAGNETLSIGLLIKVLLFCTDKDKKASCEYNIVVI